MADIDYTFLRLTFDGGRFVGHSIPVDVLSELATFQDLIFTVARRLFLDENTDRKRMPKGFADAGQLFLATTEHNCFTAWLQRRSDNHDLYFAQARDISIAALAASAQDDGALPSRFPKEAYKQLVAVGKRLGDGEGMRVRNGVGPEANVTKLSRTLLATMVNVPLEFDDTIDGEVEGIDDKSRTFVLRNKNVTLNVPFDPAQRDFLADAFRERPLLGIRFDGVVTVSDKVKQVKQVKDLEIFEHSRADDIRKVWDRIAHLSTEIEDGWNEGEGLAVAENARWTARSVLTRLLADFDSIVRPKIYPTLDGGIQAEWTLGAWVCEVAFSPDGKARGEATDAENDKEQEIDLTGVNTNNADQLASWLRQMANSGEEDRV